MGNNERLSNQPAYEQNVPMAALRSALAYLMTPLWGEKIGDSPPVFSSGKC